MTIQEIIRNAMELNISYGEYVKRYIPPEKDQPPNTPVHACVICGRDISERSHTARYCLECAGETARESARIRERERRSRM